MTCVVNEAATSISLYVCTYAIIIILFRNIIQKSTGIHVFVILD